ncbi:MAG: hypothetical protein J5817_11060 [Treponema sp.]|nr:hypothetical protein [Treponema sp.]
MAGVSGSSELEPELEQDAKQTAAINMDADNSPAMQSDIFFFIITP